MVENVKSIDTRIDEFVRASRKLTGQVIVERPLWNTGASADAIRHFAHGIGDDNPLWLDRDYATSKHGALLAPPTFLTSVLYPMLHGAAIEVPLTSLIGELEYWWERRIPENTQISAVARQVDLQESRDRAGRRLVQIISEVDYCTRSAQLVGRARGTLVRVAQTGKPLLLERGVRRYDESELKRIQEELLSSRRRSGGLIPDDDLRVGAVLPTLVVGPMTIGDLVCWQSAIGPSYRGGVLGLRDCLDAPHTAVTNPAIGWPVKYSQQHEDFTLSAMRGMPAPFDNGAMRLSQMARQLTDWMGDGGFLQRLRVQMTAPILYGDTTWFEAVIRHAAEEHENMLLRMQVEGKNQLGEVNTRADAEVRISLAQCERNRPSRHVARVGQGSRLPPPDATTSHRLGAPIGEWHDVDLLVRRRAVARPQAIAVVSAEGTITYAELDRRAAGLAEDLRQAGVERGSTVGVLVRRTLDMAVCPLAVLKSGAAYLPLDPGAPSSRLDALIADANPSLVLTTTATMSRLDSSPVPSLRVDRNVSAQPGTPDSHGSRGLFDKCLAYVIHTSGTASQPKAVGVTRASLGRYMASLQKELRIDEADVYLHTAPLSFSAAVRQLWLPLSTGARLVIADESSCRDPELLFTLMGRESVTVWDTVPTFWNHCLTFLKSKGGSDREALLPKTLRLICTTGEALRWTVARRWQEEFRQSSTILNLYSQTETAGTTSLYSVASNNEGRTGNVPLGWSLSGVEISCRDRSLLPVPIGEVGEICVAGSRLAEGYVGRPQLTEEKFRPDLLSSEPGRRLVRTGDFGRMGADGALEYVGRVDRRVKIRGSAVELQEVEAVLQEHQAIEQAAVVTREDRGGSTTMAAFLVSPAHPKPSPAALRTFVSCRLPDYMVPSTFEYVTHLPLTDRGKLDHTALSRLVESSAESRGTAQAPEMPVARVTIEVWADVLGRDWVGMDEHFLVAGGDSLSAVRVLAQLRERLGVDISVGSLFAANTASEFAELVAHALDAASSNTELR